MNAAANKEAFFAEAVDWDVQTRERERKTRIAAQRIAVGASALAGLSVLAVISLLPLKQIVPTVIRVDNATGAYDVQTPGETLIIAEPRNQKIVVSDVGKYVSAREGFTRGEAESNYRTVFFMSCGPVRGEWTQYFSPETNPNSPVKTMLPTDSERVDIQNYTFLPTDTEDIRVIQVRFDKTLVKGVAAPVKTRYIATMSIRYDKNNIPLLTKDQHINAFGFCVINYRRDQEGAPIVLGTVAGKAAESEQQAMTGAAVSVGDRASVANPGVIGMPPESPR